MNTEFNNFALTDFKRRQCYFFIYDNFMGETDEVGH